MNAILYPVFASPGHVLAVVTGGSVPLGLVELAGLVAVAVAVAVSVRATRRAARRRDADRRFE